MTCSYSVTRDVVDVDQVHLRSFEVLVLVLAILVFNSIVLWVLDTGLLISQSRSSVVVAVDSLIES